MYDRKKTNFRLTNDRKQADPSPAAVKKRVAVRSTKRDREVKIKLANADRRFNIESSKLTKIRIVKTANVIDVE